MSFEQADTPTCNVCVWRPDPEGGHKRLSTSQGCPVHEPAKPWPVEQCRSPRCGRNIIWAKTERLRDMPVNAEPDPEGTLLLSWDFVTVRVITTRTANQRFGKTLYTSHFATCRDADRYRARSAR
jgi:hypothetical protein